MQVPRLLLLIGIILVAAISSPAQNGAAPFLLWKPSAVSMAQGGTGAANSMDATSIWYNPSLLNSIYTVHAVGSFVKPLPDSDQVSHSFAAVSFPFAENQVIAVSANIFQLDNMPGFTSAGSGYTADYAWHPKVSYAFAARENISFGANLGLLCYQFRRRIADGTTEADPLRRITLGLGLNITSMFSKLTIQLDDVSFLPVQSYMPRPDPGGIHFGMSLTNLGSDLSLEQSAWSEPMPSVLRTGLSYVFISSNYLSLVLNADLEKRLAEEDVAQFLLSGADLRVYNVLSLRAGRVNALNDQYNSFNTWGFGFHLRYFSLNFARYNVDSEPVWHYDASFHVEL